MSTVDVVAVGAKGFNLPTLVPMLVPVALGSMLATSCSVVSEAGSVIAFLTKFRSLLSS
jgi:hypothetical protein